VANTEMMLANLARVGAAVRLRELEAEIQAIRKQFPGLDTSSKKAAKIERKRHRKLSAAGRARIAEAQRKRWATARQASASEAQAQGKRNGMSAAARKAVSLRMKKFWAAKRKAKAA